MSIEDDSGGGGSRTGLWVAIAVAVALLLLVALWLATRPAPQPTSSTAKPSVPPVTAAPPEPQPLAEAPAAATTPARRASPKAKPAPVEAAAPVAAPLLKVDSDVPGATVFVDRVDVGTTPLTTSQVTPGSHTVVVVADGYESQTHTVEVTSGGTDLMVRFKVVRLNEAIPVVHKHTIGSCE